MNIWGKMLGTIWTRDQIKQMVSSKETSVVASEVFIPLAQGINPELIDGLKKTFRVHEGNFIGGGEYRQETGEEIVNLGDLSREEFLRFANQATGVMKDLSTEQAKRERTVTIGEGIGSDEDPKLQRIREQIAASKRFTSG
jgi:hypothetical protein